MQCDENLQRETFLKIIKEFIEPGSSQQINISFTEQSRLMGLKNTAADLSSWLGRSKNERQGIFDSTIKELIEILQGSSVVSRKFDGTLSVIVSPKATERTGGFAQVTVKEASMMASGLYSTI